MHNLSIAMSILPWETRHYLATCFLDEVVSVRWETLRGRGIAEAHGV
jgi:hypothetical protein